MICLVPETEGGFAMIYFRVLSTMNEWNDARLLLMRIDVISPAA